MTAPTRKPGRPPSSATPEKCKRILEYIIQCQVEGYTPTRKEIAHTLRIPQISLIKCYLPMMEKDMDGNGPVIHIHDDDPRRIDVLRPDAYQPDASLDADEKG